MSIRHDKITPWGGGSKTFALCLAQLVSFKGLNLVFKVDSCVVNNKVRV